MTCLEAQSKIIAYIDYNLERDEKIDFLQHIHCCENCREELNIYYTMIVGMRQLDNNIPLSKDFTQELTKRMDGELKKTKKQHKFFQISLLCSIFILCTVAIFGYVKFLNVLHENEQNALKEKQGQYYYSDFFESYLFEPNQDKMGLEINVTTQETESSFYERVRKYKMLQE